MRCFVGSVAGAGRDAGPGSLIVVVGLRQGRARSRREEGVQGGQRGIPGAGLQEGGRTLRRGAAERPEPRSGLLLPGNSYDNQYKPSKKGEPANDALLDKAVENYQMAAEKLRRRPRRDDKKLGQAVARSTCQAAYGPDKLNDPAKAEPIVQKMIQLEPSEPSELLRRSPRSTRTPAPTTRRRQTLHQGQGRAKPNDPAVYMTLAGYYNRQGQFDKTIEALEQRAANEPNNPEAFHTIATYYWDEAHRRRHAERQPRSASSSARASRRSTRRCRSRPTTSRRSLQGPAPPAPGQPGKGSGQAAGADQGSRQARATRPTSCASRRRQASARTNCSYVPYQPFGSRPSGICLTAFLSYPRHNRAVKYSGHSNSEFPSSGVSNEAL